ncbi:MAG: PaaI family thioesterase [Minwuia sp.]|uniref:PaaI family thioesterase n=1 Tax=Minwuia sp. TaxID=2493630 RepID=UPI003A8C57F6
MRHPYAELIGFEVTGRDAGESTLTLKIRPEHMNPHGVAHGAVLYALADTGMGAALYSLLEEGQACATVTCAINYFRPVGGGTVTCRTFVRNKGRTIAALESEIWNGEKLAATAQGQFSIFAVRPPKG